MNATHRTLDARGLACPEPVILTRKALAEGGFETLEVVVDNDAARENVLKFAEFSRCPVARVEAAEGVFRLWLAPAGAPSVVREVGFRQVAGASRIFVRTSATPQYTVQQVDDHTLRIEVANARPTRRNDLRFMDTSFFPSAVQLITPSRQGSSYVLTVKLRQRVPYQEKVEGDTLAIDFQRPAGGDAAKPAKGDAAAPAEEQAE